VRNVKTEQASVEQGRMPSQQGRMAHQQARPTWPPLEQLNTCTMMISS